MWLMDRMRKNRSVIIGGSVVILFVALSLLADIIAPYDPIDQDLRATLLPPNAEHWMGTDNLGRDIFSRIIYGARISLTIGGAAVLLSATVGIFLGTVAGYYGKLVDEALMRIIDAMMAFPSILLALVMVTILGTGLRATIIAVGIASIPRFARLIRASVLAAKAQTYVEAAQCVGRRDRGIVLYHILPNCLSPMIVQATLLAAQAILIASGLGFLGLGAQPPTPEWGTMLSDGRGLLRAAPHVATFPGLAILAVALAFNLLGDGLRDVLDVQL